MARLMWQAVAEIDVRGVLAGVRTPTMVLARRGDRIAPFEAAEALAAGIPNAELRELPPGEHYAVDLTDLLPQAVLEFVGQQADAVPAERVLSTVLFTDIVGSTGLLAAQGDEHWRRQLDDHDRLVDSGAGEVRRPAGQAHRRRDLRAVRRPDEGGPLRPRPGARAGHPRHPDPRRSAHR